ncbi:PH domain-containing protein [Catenuloplanes atrovinosus]|uniref:Membrane protein YdbS with pleckstrin-like domain n=1 Tax=Catenuloplanes atrovinosus TaxID=137266 RepID=A0AAE4CBA2_9ACTN|nr:PH domain-containing protein [Catenuloplanes atrovinosus]MDR7275400.1 membrane protein YdbS with pleckstrin-like domain [Catenuloplanes atrovinosus]
MVHADVLRPPRYRVDRRFVLWRTLRAAIGAVVVLVPLGAVYLLVDVTRPWIGPVWLVLDVVYLIGIAVTPAWRYRVHRWEATGDAVYALEGWLTRKWQIVPISRIQSIDTEIGPIQNLLGLATIKVTTASSEGAISIEGLDRETAEATVDRLRAVTAATPGDAT